MKLGRHQIDMLAVLSHPVRMLIVPCKVSKSLERRGLVKSRGERTDGFIQITPAGLRALADAHEWGYFDAAVKKALTPAATENSKARG